MISRCCQHSAAKRFIAKDGILVGMILVGDVGRVGIYTYPASEKIPPMTARPYGEMYVGE